MADADSTLEILIKTVFDATGYRMNEVEAQKLRESVSRTAVVSAEANVADAVATDKLLLSKRELRHVVGALGAEAVPELSRALATLAYGGGATAGIFLLVGAFELVRKAIITARDEVRKLAAQIAIDARDAAESSSQSWNDFIAKLHQAKDPAEELATVYGRQKSLLDDISTAHTKILEQMEKEELAGAKGDKAKEEEIRARFDQNKMNYEVASGQAQILLHQQYIDQLKSRQPGLNQAAELAARDVSYLKGTAAVPSGFKIDDAQESKLRIALSLAQGAAARAETGSETGPERIIGKSLTDRREELAAAQKQYDQYIKNRDALNDYNARLEAEGKVLTDNQEARDKNKTLIEKETGALNIERDKASSQVAGDAIGKAIELSGRAAAGGKLNASESQYVQSLGSMVSGQSVTLQTAEHLFTAMSKNSTAINFALARIVSLLERMPDPSQWERRLAQLESRFNKPNQ